MQWFGLRADQWERIKDLLPGREGSVGATAADNRLFVEAVLYRYRTGMPWRDLPERFGDGRQVHLRFSRWAKTGVWERVFHHLAADADNEYAMCAPISIAPAPKKSRRGPGDRPLARRTEGARRESGA
jgi:transposase